AARLDGDAAFGGDHGHARTTRARVLGAGDDADELPDVELGLARRHRTELAARELGLGEALCFVLRLALEADRVDEPALLGDARRERPLLERLPDPAVRPPPLRAVEPRLPHRAQHGGPGLARGVARLLAR